MSRKDHRSFYLAAYSELFLYLVVPLVFLFYSLGTIDQFMKLALYIALGIQVILFVCWMIRSDKTFYLPSQLLNYPLFGKRGKVIMEFLRIVSYSIFLYWLFSRPPM